MTSVSNLSSTSSSMIDRFSAVDRAATVAATTVGKTGGGYGSVADSVSLSPLGKSLHDESLVVFNALSDKQRGQLVSLVDSGKMTGEEVHDALKQRLKEARSSALNATHRMFSKDHDDLYRNPGATGDDLNNALADTLKRRSSLIENMTAATSDDERQSLSDELASRGLGPDRTGLLGKQRYIMPQFFTPDLADSRIASTRKEGDAAYKLQSLGFDLDGVDQALRSIGEQDSAAILSERAGLPSSRVVARDSSFSMEDAVIQPLAFPQSNGGSVDENGFLARMRAQDQWVQNTSGPVGVVRRIDKPITTPVINDFPTSARVDREADAANLAYIKGLKPRY